MAETFDKNMIDKDEYPRTAELEQRCVNMLSRLWNSPDEDEATGTSTTGSSEAAMLAGMALKWRWRDRQRAAGKPTDQPNMVMGANVQVCWEKFCRYWDVEMPPRADGGRPLPPHGGAGGRALRREHDRRRRRARLDVRRVLRAGRRHLRRARPAPGRHRPRRPGARRRGVGRVHRAVPRPRPRVGLPAPTGAVDQRLGPQVRARVPGRGLGRSGATPTRCPTTSCSRSTTWAATCRRSR